MNEAHPDYDSLIGTLMPKQELAQSAHFNHLFIPRSTDMRLSDLALSLFLSKRRPPPGVTKFDLADHGRPWSTMIDHGRPRSTMVDHGRPRSTMVDQGRPWSAMIILHIILLEESQMMENAYIDQRAYGRSE